ncbi:NAD(P)-dependent oxidoreductase [Marinibaculum pumilum]|uniref:NAD(P)-dependent oxidoreductase n=1 Tax=Marinibaculum pumilum TaxID=1766165 RepID=A0ABV7L2N7_9PROT
MAQDELVAVTNRIFPETRDRLMQAVRVAANDGETPWPEPQLRAALAEATGLMAFMTDRIDAELLAAAPRLKVIGAALKGHDNIDLEAATRAGVWVAIVPDLLTAPTAELAIGLMLALGRHILEGDRGIRAHGFAGWRPRLYGCGLQDMTVGLVGYGLVGRAIASRLHGFGCHLLAHDLQAPAGRPAGLPGEPVSFRALPELLAVSDYVVLALPLTDRTRHVIDAGALAQMKPGARLVNPARGSLVDEEAVADALERGRLAGYAADVFACEDWAQADRPRGIDPRLTAPGAPTVLTPHVGSATTAARRSIELAAAESILDALAGRVPRCAVNDPR